MVSRTSVRVSLVFDWVKVVLVVVYVCVGGVGGTRDICVLQLNQTTKEIV